MNRARVRLGASIALLVAALAGGCGFGSGPSTDGTAELTVTRDYGTNAIASAEFENPKETETALSLLDRAADIETRYGGGFVNSIDGIEGSRVVHGRSFDWFYYVNGTEAPIGSAELEIAAGDRVWWDYRDWTDAMRVPAVVGSWPEPFRQASEPTAQPVPVQCAGVTKACEAVSTALREEGVEASDSTLSEAPTARIVVGTWDGVKRDPAAALLAAEPETSGVFARFSGARDELVALDPRAEEAARLGKGAGLIAAVRRGEDPPTWLVTGVDAEGVEAAAAALTPDALGNRYAVVVGAGSDSLLPVPVLEEG